MSKENEQILLGLTDVSRLGKGQRAKNKRLVLSKPTDRFVV